MLKNNLCVLTVLGGLMAVPALADAAKTESCTYQADVVEAVRQARIARVNERGVKGHVEAKATWPAQYNAAIPLVTPWVYEMKMRDVRTQDLAGAWKELCLQQ